MTHNKHSNDTHTRTHERARARHQHHHRRPGGDTTVRERAPVRPVGKERRRKRRGEGLKQNHTQHQPRDIARPQTQNTWTVLPGITEIVFKALRTLNVRRADTLPRFTNSVIYLQGGSDTVTQQPSHTQERKNR